jgi:hypothetical protein
MSRTPLPLRRRAGPPLKKLNWTKLAAARLRGTMWDSAPEEQGSAADLVDEAEIEKLFTLQRLGGTRQGGCLRSVC